MNILNLIISLVSGALGGNAAGAVMKEKSLGTVGNSVAGILGGGIGGAILQALGIGNQAATGGGMDLGSIIASIAGGGVGGGILMTIISWVRRLRRQAGLTAPSQPKSKTESGSTEFGIGGRRHSHVRLPSHVD